MTSSQSYFRSSKDIRRAEEARLLAVLLMENGIVPARTVAPPRKPRAYKTDSRHRFKRAYGQPASYKEAMTFEEIASHLGVTHQAVSAIYARAMEKIRKAIYCNRKRYSAFFDYEEHAGLVYPDWNVRL